MNEKFSIKSRLNPESNSTCESIIPIIPRDSNVIVKAVGTVSKLELLNLLEGRNVSSLRFKTYEVVAFGNHVDFISIGDKVLIPSGIPLSAAVTVPGNDKSLITMGNAFDGKRRNEIQSLLDTNYKNITSVEIIEYLGCRSGDIVAVYDKSYVIEETPKSTIIL